MAGDLGLAGVLKMSSDCGSPEKISARLEYLCSEIRRHNELYYLRDDPEITDDQYDELLREYKELGAETRPAFEKAAASDAGMDFVAIDVETANADLASICQIGIAEFKDGALAGEWVSLVNPEDYFDAVNIGIHGIDEDKVKGAPIFPDIIETLCSMLNNKYVVCHTHFDKTSLGQAQKKYGLNKTSCRWLDSARVARRAWEEVARSGYGLKPVCKLIGYEFSHHDALEDAKAAGQIILAASKKTGLDIQGWAQRVEQPIGNDGTGEKTVKREGNPDGPLLGERVVFTGSLTIIRAQAADMAATLGCSVDGNVTSNTTMLVIGDQDVYKLAGKDKSSKQIKAEGLIKKGQGIRILSEKDFKKIFKDAQA